MPISTILQPDWDSAAIEAKGLPRFSPDQLSAIKAEVSEGAGFALVDGVVAADNPNNAAAQVAAFGRQLGTLLIQNERRETVVEIADFSDEDERDDRGLRSPGELTPHTDPPPMIALYCVRGAWQGGRTTLVNALRVHNQVRDEDEAAFQRLCRGYPSYVPDLAGKGTGSVRPRVPIFADDGDGLSCVYYRPFIEKAAEMSGAPLGGPDVDALDRFDAAAQREENIVSFDLQAGEMLVLSNFRVMHARAPYQDWPEKERRRLLLRLWLDADWMAKAPVSQPLRRNTAQEFERAISGG